MIDSKIILIPTVQCKDRRELHHSLENIQCPYCQIKTLKAQLKREMAVVDLLSDKEFPSKVSEWMFLVRHAEETVKARIALAKANTEEKT